MSDYLELEEQANQLVSHLESLRSSITSFDSAAKDLGAMRESFANTVQQLTICAEAMRDITAKLKELDEAALLEAIASLRADVLAQKSGQQTTASHIRTLHQEVLQAKRSNTIWNLVLIALFVLGVVVILVVARNGTHVPPDSAANIKEADYAPQCLEGSPVVQARSATST